MADPLTMAYIGKGAEDYLRLLGPPSATLMDKFGGELGLMAEIIKHADRVDAVDCDGSHAYDVAEPFGYVAMDDLFNHGEIDVEKCIEAVTS